MTLSEYFQTDEAKKRGFKVKFANSIGVKKGSLSRYLNGERIPVTRVSVAIERETGGMVTVAELLGESR